MWLMFPPGPSPSRSELPAVVELLRQAAQRYLAAVDDRPVTTDRVEAALASFREPLPEAGTGATPALERLIGDGLDATATTSGPRCFHFVIGGATPAALGGDWLASLLDQIAYTWVSSPLAVELELLCLDWLKDLFGLRPELAGVMTTGASMANFVGLAVARQWWGEEHGVDIAEEGFGELPPVPVLTSGYIHASAIKVLGLLGIGRASVVEHSADATGRVDLAALEEGLRALGGRPAIVVATAGEVNAGEFDPIDRMADLAAACNAWLHVDGAFGLFARVTPWAAELAAGAERADSVTVDGHKWLNVPYDCGFAFVRDAGALGRAFRYTADYLPDPADPRPTLGSIGPESSRRARALAVWATLQAYGRSGYRELVERHLELAGRLADAVDEANDLERLAEVPLNIVCFRYNPGGLSGDELDRLNERLGDAILEDGRVYAGTTRHAGRVALRPAIVNWRTRAEDVDLFVDVVRELGARLHASP
jgi:glutamate/tyrosine decarboxylase-like PLP-dependent enzyme